MAFRRGPSLIRFQQLAIQIYSEAAAISSGTHSTLNATLFVFLSFQYLSLKTIQPQRQRLSSPGNSERLDYRSYKNNKTFNVWQPPYQVSCTVDLFPHSNIQKAKAAHRITHERRQDEVPSDEHYTFDEIDLFYFIDRGKSHKLPALLDSTACQIHVDRAYDTVRQ